MSNYVIPGDTLTEIADAIRLKRDTVDEITPEDMPMEIDLIESGGGGLREIIICEDLPVTGSVQHIPIIPPLPNDLPLFYTTEISKIDGSAITSNINVNCCCNSSSSGNASAQMLVGARVSGTTYASKGFGVGHPNANGYGVVIWGDNTGGYGARNTGAEAEKFRNATYFHTPQNNSGLKLTVKLYYLGG